MIISNESELPAQVLNLPENFVVPEKRIKRSARPVDFDVFYDEQKVAVDMIVDYIEGKSKWRMITLRGYAGTGKTFVVGRLQDFLLYAKKLKVAFSAPTNKAVQVAKDMCEISDSNLVFTTVHRLLGLKESYDQNGRLKFIPDPANPPSLTGYDVLFIDEASMFDDDLFKMIEPFVDEGVKIIFVGDPAQIPPINRVDCIPFIKMQQLKYQIGVCDLVTVRRQSSENPLLDFATKIRTQRKQEQFNYEYQPIITNGMGIIPIYRDAKTLIRNICEVYFANDIFAAYPDFMKVIAWRNDAVNAVNRIVRKLIYKQDNLPMLMPGEKMIADEPIRTQEQAILTTNSEFEIVSYEIGTTKYVGVFKNDVVVREEFKYYHVKVAAMTDKGLRYYHMWIVHEDSLLRYQTAIAEMKRYVFTKFGYERTEAWREYYKLFNFFAKVKYNYAITAHKAQGSTYENTMILEWDMNENVRFEERNRIRYVAATRARTQLFVIK